MDKKDLAIRAIRNKIEGFKNSTSIGNLDTLVNMTIGMVIMLDLLNEMTREEYQLLMADIALAHIEIRMNLESEVE